MQKPFLSDGIVYRRHKGLPVNEDAFSEPLSQEAEYWIGFLLADGNVSGGFLQLTLKACDVGHIEKFRAFMGSEAAIHSANRGKAFGIHIGSVSLCSSLANYNIVPRKSLMIGAPRRLVRSPNFWRGVIDGDGCILQYTVDLVGGIDLVTQWSEFVAHFGRRPSIRHIRDLIFRCTAHGDAMRGVLQALYGGDGPRLQRKAEAAFRNLGWIQL